MLHITRVPCDWHAIIEMSIPERLVHLYQLSPIRCLEAYIDKAHENKHGDDDDDDDDDDENDNDDNDDDDDGDDEEEQ